VTFVSGQYVISQLLIDTALADPVGVGNDGTTAAQVRGITGNPYGFEIDGVTSTNLGGVLGLQNGDIITEVSNQPTETYDDLLDVAAILLSASTATVELIRGTASVTLIYQRGT
jgi:membrane-associated protease RseP (regulator of RpoE activity)